MSIERNIRANQTIFYQGEATVRVHRVVNGLVRAYVIHDDGEEATVAYFGPGDVFPLTAAYDISAATLFYYETVTDTTVDVMTLAELHDYIDRSYKREIDRFATRYVGALLHVSALTQPTAKMKLAHTLRYLAIRFGEKTAIGKRIKITIKLTQHDLAKLCNLSRETVSIELGTLKREEVIIVKEKFYFVHITKLNHFINEDSTAPIRLSQ